MDYLCTFAACRPVIGDGGSIGELLLKEKRITPEQLQEALNYQRQNGGKLGFNLIKLGYVKDDEITALLSKRYGVPSIALGRSTSMLRLSSSSPPKPRKSIRSSRCHGQGRP